MRTIICLLALISLSQTALIGSTIYSLSRLFQYKITLQNNDKTLVEYATLAPTNQNCPSGKCFIGWVNNYTLGNVSYQGFRKDLRSSNPIFSAHMVQPSSLTLTNNNSLSVFNKTLLDLTAKIITPISFASYQSNSKLSYFMRLENSTLLQMTSFSLNYSLYNFQQMANSWLSTSSWVGWSNNNPNSDVMLFDSGLNCILMREMVFQVQKTKISVELVSKSVFTDMEMHSQMIQEIQACINNVENMTIDQKIVYPADVVASLIQIL